MASIAVNRKCTFEEGRDGNRCGRLMVRIGDAAPICPVHDRIKCRCGHRLIAGTETSCPTCGRDNRLQSVLKGGA